MKVTLKQLSVFADVVKYQSLSVVAKKNSISQPAVSKTITQLEDSLDMALFDRGGGKFLRLTNAGKMLYDKAVDIVDRVHEVEAIELSDTDRQGKITIGASVTIHDYFLPKILLKFKQKYPNIDIELMRGLSQDIAIAVEDSICDIGFIEGEIPSSFLETTFLKEDSIDIICSKKNPLSKKDTVTLEDILRDSEWIAWKSGAGARNIIVDKDKVDESILKAMGLEGKRFDNNSTVFSDVEFGDDARLILDTKSMRKMLCVDSPEALRSYVANSSNAFGALSKYMLNQIKSRDIKRLDVEGLIQVKNFNIIRNKNRYTSNVLDIFLGWVGKQKF